MKGIVTINTDAAYHFKHKVGAFAYWIVSDYGRILMSGALKGKVSGPDEAEMQCIINAMHTVSNQKFPDVRLIVINTDALNSIHVFGKNKAAIAKYHLKKYGPLRDRFHKLSQKIGGTGLSIKFKHIPSHVHTDTPRNWVNDWCDKNAKICLHQKIEGL